MRRMPWLWRRVRGIWRADEIGREIAEEMQFHIDMRTEANMRQGMTEDEARREAEKRFGNKTEMGEAGYDVRGGAWIETLWQDLKFALRMFAKRPAFSAAAIASLALGIGASTAIFSVVDGVLLKPLPYPEPDRVVQVREVSAKGNQMPVAEPNFVDLHDRSRSFDALAVYGGGVVSVAGGSEPVRTKVAAVSADFFRVMGVRPFAGREFSADESGRAGQPVAVVSYGFWQRLLGARADLSGTTIRLPDRTLTVVGVMPRGFAFPTETEVWIPAESDGPPNTSRTAHNWSVVGRLKADAPIETTRAEVSSLGRQLRQEHGEAMDAVDFAVIPLQEYMVGRVRAGLFVLLGAVALLMLIACANVANMLLARATSRSKEFAMRAALGATRWRLARQSLTECLLLVLVACGLGVLLSYWLLGALLGLTERYLPRTSEIGVDGWSLVYACALSLVVGVVLGLVPTLRGRTASAKPWEGGRASTDAASSRLGSGLVVAQVAVALLLAVGAGLLGRSFFTLLQVDPGFHPESAVAMTLSPPEAPDDEPRAPQITRFEAPLLERLARIPGVTAVGCASSLPMTNEGPNGTFLVDNDFTRNGDAEYRIVSDGYFTALGIPLLGGRGFSPTDAPDAPQVALVSRSLAERYFPNGDAIGQRLQFGNMDGDTKLMEVVGIVGDVREYGLDRDVRPVIYGNAMQRPRPWALTFVVRGDADPASLVSAMRTALRGQDPEMAATFRTLEQIFSSSVDDRRFSLVLFAVFASVALVLAITGIYGVMSYSVAQRTREIGIRMALGAKRANVLGLVMGRGLKLTVVGVAIGLVGALALARVLTGLLYGVSATDPITLAGISALLIGAALLACLAPARRATKVDPMVTLKYE